MPKNQSPASASSLDEIAELRAQLRERDARIDRLLGAVERLTGAMEAQRAAPAVAEPPPAAARIVDTYTVADAWSRYRTKIQHKTWFRTVVPMMIPALIAWAPSVVEPRPRRGSSPARRPIAGPDMLVATLKPFHWHDLRATLAKNSVTYRNLTLARLKAMFSDLVQEGVLSKHPLEKVKREPKRPRRETTITEEQLQQILSQDDRPAVRAYILLAHDTGMRSNEVRCLEWSQINLGSGLIRLSWTGTKTKETRPVWASARSRLALLEVPRAEGARYVFPSPYNPQRPISQPAAWAWWRRACDAAGIEAAPGDGTVHAHDLRHSFAAAALRKGARLNQLQRMLGHKRITTTELYSHATDDDAREGFEVLRKAERKPPHRSDDDES